MSNVPRVPMRAALDRTLDAGRANRIGIGALLILGVIGLVILQYAGNSVLQGFFVNLGMFIILVASLNLASGFTGVFSLGHIGFMALGAYASALLTLPTSVKTAYLPNLPGWLAATHLDFTIGTFPAGFLLATLLGAAFVAVIAMLVGAVLMRLSGNFVSVATLGFLVIVRVVLINADTFTRGSRTFSNVTGYTDLWWVYGWVLVVLYCLWRLKFSSFGRAMFAQRDNMAAAKAVGIVIMRPRLLAFVLSAAFTAVAGALWGHFITSFSPSTFYFDLTFRVITMLVVGGMGSVSGSVIGPTVILLITEGLRRMEDSSQLYGISGLLLSILLIVIIIVRPQGLFGDRELNFARFMRPGTKAMTSPEPVQPHDSPGS